MQEQRQSSSRTGSTLVPWTRQRAWTTKRSQILGGGAGLLAAAVVAASFLGGVPTQPEAEVVVDIPRGTPFREIVNTLHRAEVISRPDLFSFYARLRGLDREVRAGTYRLPRGARFSDIHTALAEGRVQTLSVTVPEGLTIKRMAVRIAVAAGSDSTSVADALRGDSLHSDWGVPGPGLEGYLFPDTYRFAQGVGLERVVSAMIQRYHGYWTPERRQQLAETGLSEREVVTLASIIQAEAAKNSEMRTISSVYHNRLRRGMLLQADPTVLYALGGHRSRLLYAAIDSVADHPYNTYTQPGLPPGPICAPGAQALDAALDPAVTDYLYFVALPNSEHIFSRSLREHNAARQLARRNSEGG